MIPQFKFKGDAISTLSFPNCAYAAWIDDDFFLYLHAKILMLKNYAVKKTAFDYLNELIYGLIEAGETGHASYKTKQINPHSVDENLRLSCQQAKL